MPVMNMTPPTRKRKTMSAKPGVLITGASTGIGATYADRFARRGHNLVLVARNIDRMNAIAAKLRTETGVKVDVLQADLTKPDDLAKVEARLRDDSKIGILINNAGTANGGSFVEQSADAMSQLIALNATALVRLASAVAPRFAKAGEGAIINIGSVVGLAPEFGMTVYGATKAFVLFLSQGLSLELGPKGVYIQAVLPATTRTEIWDHIGADVNKLSNVMEVSDLVDAALVGFDRREPVTIPPLPDDAQWEAADSARKSMLANFGNALPAARYRESA
jgi:short-subunit dehydrogenase